MIDYRRDIDGLRGVAVLAVILSHTGISFFKGGFVGVDIFFVISGYLITATILSEMSIGKFSLPQFYMRRIRRIFPALFCVLLCTIPFAYYWMMPIQLYNFGQSLLATSIFVSNFLFFFEHGYFDHPSTLKPLLHTWSLGVEEQFYVIYPIFILVLWGGIRKAIGPIILGLIAFSFAISIAFEIIFSEKFAFFLTPARVWELLCGALVYIFLRSNPSTHKQFLSSLGVALLNLGFLLAGLQVGLASVYTAFTVIGTCLLIGFPNNHSWSYMLLSSQLFIGMGTISYSAYLWHQPVFAFAHIRSFTSLSLPIIGGLLGLILVLSCISWRYVEQPFRNKNEGAYRISTPKVIMLTLLCTALFASFSIVVMKTTGLPDRMPKQLTELLKSEHANVNRKACHHSPRKLAEGRIQTLDCLPRSPQGNYDFIILGDSHADSIAGEILSKARMHKFYGNQITVSACSPFLGYNFRTIPCHNANRKVYSYIKTTNAHTLIISARYSKMLGLGPFVNGEGGVESTKGIEHKFLGYVTGNDTVDFKARVQSGMNDFIKKFDRIIIVYPIPEAGWHVPQRVVKEALFKKNYSDISTSYDQFLLRNKDVLSTLDSLKDPRIIRVRPSRQLCSNNIRCMNVLNKNALYNDAHHLSSAGAAIVAPDIIDALIKEK